MNQADPKHSSKRRKEKQKSVLMGVWGQGEKKQYQQRNKKQ